MRLATVLAGLGLCLASLGANASIFFSPPIQSVDLGNQVSVDVVIDDLGNFGPPSLSAFDLDVNFDDSLLGVAGVTFGPGLDHGILGSFRADLGIPGGHNVLELSFEGAATLNAFQPASFVLFTLTFDTLAAGTSALSISVNDLVDEQFPPGSFSTSTDTGSIQINAPTGIPEPGPLALMVLGFLLLGVTRQPRGA